MSDNEKTDSTMSKALDAIHDEATRLLSLVPAGKDDLSGGLHLIISISRYKYDVRSVEEIKRSQGE